MSYLDSALGEKPTKEQLEYVLDRFRKPIPPTTREQVADCIDRYYVMQRSSASMPIGQLRRELKSLLSRDAYFHRFLLSDDALRFFILNAPDHLDEDRDIANYFIEEFKGSKGRPTQMLLFRSFLFSQLRTCLEHSQIKVGRSFFDCDVSPKGDGLGLVRDIFLLLYPNLTEYQFQDLVIHRDTKPYTKTFYPPLRD